MKVLIFGHTGYIGSQIFKCLSTTCEVYGASRSSLNVKNEFNVDITDISSFKSIDSFNDPWLIIICSAVLPTYNYTNDYINRLFSVNVLGVNNILNWSRSVNVKKVLFLSTLSIIDESAFLDGPVDEECSNYNIHNHYWYSLTKLMAEQCIKAETLKNNQEYQILRLSSVYGGSVLQDGVIKSFIEKVKCNQGLVVNNEFESADFVHVNDVVEAVKQSIKLGYNGKLNVASGRPITMLELAKIVSQCIHLPIEITVERREEKPLKLYSVKKLREMLGDYKLMDIQQGIREFF